jgi:RimJ/RimL family protein N-acetyltransferase
MSQDYKLIQTERLDLLCLTADELFELGRNPEVFGLRDFENPYRVLSGEDLPRASRVKDVREKPENIRWYFRMIVDRSRNLGVGSISFHGGPDERGMVEIGLGIAEAARGKGYATEALRAMWDWAAQLPEVKFLRYTVSPENLPSVAIINKLGVPLVGEQIDEEDGLELIYEISVEDYLTQSYAEKSESDIVF